VEHGRRVAFQALAAGLIRIQKRYYESSNQSSESDPFPMTIEFSVGSLVQIKSGGPVMTAVKIMPNDTGVNVYCTWYCNSDHIYKDGVFPAESLVLTRAGVI
jgi:uncharacterized protein YodC (DUF2158 family)